MRVAAPIQRLLAGLGSVPRLGGRMGRGGVRWASGPGSTPGHLLERRQSRESRLRALGLVPTMSPSLGHCHGSERGPETEVWKCGPVHPQTQGCPQKLASPTDGKGPPSPSVTPTPHRRGADPPEPPPCPAGGRGRLCHHAQWHLFPKSPFLLQALSSVGTGPGTLCLAGEGPGRTRAISSQGPHARVSPGPTCAPCVRACVRGGGGGGCCWPCVDSGLSRARHSATLGQQPRIRVSNQPRASNLVAIFPLTRALSMPFWCPVTGTSHPTWWWAPAPAPAQTSQCPGADAVQAE